MKLLTILILASSFAAAQTKPSPKQVTPAKQETQQDNIVVQCEKVGVCGTRPYVTIGDDGSAEINSQAGRIVKLSDSEYAELQKLRQAVSAKEVEIAKAHGVDFGSDTCHIETICYSNIRPPDRYEFAGQFLLVNVPAPKAAKP